MPGSSGHNKKEAKPKPKAKLSKWEEASQISKETTTEQLQQKAIRFMVDFFKFSPTPNRCELFLRTPNHLQATVFVNELGKEYGTMQGLRLQVQGSSLKDKTNLLKSLTKQLQALERLRSSMAAKKAGKIEEMKPALLEAFSTLQASKKLKVEITKALKES